MSYNLFLIIPPCSTGTQMLIFKVTVAAKKIDVRISQVYILILNINLTLYVRTHAFAVYLYWNAKFKLILRRQSPFYK